MAILEYEEQKVLLHEEDIGYKETNMDSLWYLDNGASNHMTGVREHFKELDEKVSGKVRFRDGSYIEIKGKGSIRIECDDEKQGSYHTKHNRAPFPKKAKARSTSPLDLVYGDLCGPIIPPTPSGKKYIFLLVDDYSRYTWVYFLSTKDQAFDTFKEYKKSIENDLRTTLKMLRTDRGGEFTSNEFTQYYFRTLNDLYENTEELPLAEDEPKNYKEASSDQKWIEAMKVELDFINRNNTWELTTLPKGHKAIGLKWVFKTKKDANGNIIKHKARLVAKGYIQDHGIDFKEVFALVARMETIRLLLAIAANNKWEDSALLIGVYVDDLIITDTPKKEIDKFKAQMEEKIEMSDLELLAFYLGIEVIQTDGDISIRQSAHANKILKEAGMIDCNETLIPMDPGMKLTKLEYKKQATVALSSCESEFIASTAATIQALWLKRLLSKLTHSPEEKVTLQVDNKSAIALMKNPVFHERSKHIDMK
nr:ribonuclease H-like domain, reverse transcriptase, RNA-dependent DNA polymerase [Tanacetum cinerariifolium]